MKTFYEYLLLEERVSRRRGEQWQIERARRNRTREERRLKRISILSVVLVVLFVLVTVSMACTTAVSAYENKAVTCSDTVFVLPMGGGLR